MTTLGEHTEEPTVQDLEAMARDVGAQWADATKPQQPEIEPPSSTDVDLFYGLEQDGRLMKHAVVRELNGADEEALARFDVKRPDYFAKVADYVVSHATLSIDGQPVRGETQRLRGLLMGDRDLLFAQICIATYGGTKTFEDIICPSCSVPNDIDVDIPALVERVPLPVEGQAWFETTLQSGRLVRFRLPTGHDQFEVFKQTDAQTTVADQNTIIIAECLQTNVGIPALDVARALALPDRRKIVKALTAAPTVKLKEVEVPCSNEKCGNNIPFVFGWAELLFG